MNTPNYEKYNYLSNTKSQTILQKNSKILPNIKSVKILKNTKNDYNNENNNNLDNDSEINNNLSQTNFRGCRKIKSKSFKLNFNKKSNNLSLNHSKNDLKNNYKNKAVKYNNNNKLLINSNNNVNDNDSNSHNNTTSHNIIISDLLIKTEKFFNQLGISLNEKNKGNLEKKKYQKIIIKKNSFIEDIENKNQNEIKEQSIKDIKAKQNLKRENNDKIYHNSNFIENDNNIIKNRSYNNILSKYNYKIIDNNLNSNVMKYNIKVYNNKDKGKKMVSDEIIQTFNILENNKQTTKNQIKDDIILPYLPPSKEKIEFNWNFNPSNNIEMESNKKNEIKIAEIKPVYPVYPYNRIINFAPLNGNKYNFNIHRKKILDMKEDLRHDDRYNYEQIMNKIKLESKNKKINVSNSYRFKYNSKNFNKMKKGTKLKELYL